MRIAVRPSAVLIARQPSRSQPRSVSISRRTSFVGERSASKRRRLERNSSCSLEKLNFTELSGPNAGGPYRPLIVEMALSTPIFLTCSLWAVNTVIAEVRLLAIALENSTYPRNLPNGASTHGSALGVVGQDLRHGAARSEIYSFSVIHAGPREEHGVPAESSHPRREDRAVLETRSSGEALTPQRSTADGRTRRRTDNLALRSLIGPQAAEPDLIVSSLWPATRPCGSAPGVHRERASASRPAQLPCRLRPAAGDRDVHFSPSKRL